jgi:hypothetical protein
MRKTPSIAALVPTVALACGGPGNGGRGSADDATSIGPVSLSASSGETGPATGDGTSTGSGPATADGTTMAPGETSAADGPVFDVGVGDVPPCSGGGGGGLDFSYIWIANSAQGTVSKIDTQTMTELGRYLVRADAAGSPSRTSVNLVGDVAVANRFGGLAKIYAREDRCVDGNGMPGIQTSTGAADIRAWGDEECLAWYTPVAQNQQRPVAWTAGTYDQRECTYVQQKIWTTAAVYNTAGSIVAMRLDGDTGIIEIELPVPELTTTSFGPYGGAVDANDDFWFHSRDSGFPHPLVHVSADGASYEIIPVPDPVAPYGITIDSSGRVWLAGYQGGTGRYDPLTGTWLTVPGVTGLGIQEDAQGRMWMAIYPWTTTGVVAFDVDSMAIVESFDMTGTAPESRGISIDFDGYVWMVDQTDSAFKIDPATGTWERYQGLTGPYTYSDMTGWGLSLVSTG